MAKPVLDENGIRQPKKGPTAEELEERRRKKPGGANGGSGDAEGGKA